MSESSRVYLFMMKQTVVALDVAETIADFDQGDQDIGFSGVRRHA
ncbi:MAG: hypothetical protein WAT09_16825 [Paracoccaceae bacterium]